MDLNWLVIAKQLTLSLPHQPESALRDLTSAGVHEDTINGSRASVQILVTVPCCSNDIPVAELEGNIADGVVTNLGFHGTLACC